VVNLENNKINLHLGNCLDVLKTFEPNSVDSIVTDVPYGLKFMSKKWDYEVPSIEIWNEVLRVLKPGGHLLSFGGTRTYHRMVVNIEDAGFEIRDQIQWLYGSGFPKSHNISKGIDKKFGAEREVVGINKSSRPNSKLKGQRGFDNQLGNADKAGVQNITAPSTDLAKQWDGYGTALKPANEPICLARKPLSEKTIVANVLKWGCGGLNIDDCRVAYQDEQDAKEGRSARKTTSKGQFAAQLKDDKFNRENRSQIQGRFPANIILDETAAAALDEQSGELKGGASRFFYCAKASKSERNAGLEGMEEKEIFGDDGGTYQGLSNSKTPDQNFHPTVKPIKLMQYLITLITPPNGIVLDPFMGSGTTGLACKNLDRNFIGIEMEKEYFEIAKKRIEG